MRTQTRETETLVDFAVFLETQGVAIEERVPHDLMTCPCEVFPCNGFDRRPLPTHELEGLWRRFVLERAW